MRKLLKYKNGNSYVVGGLASIFPNTKEKPTEYDLTELSSEEFDKIRKNPKDKELLVKAKKIKTNG